MGFARRFRPATGCLRPCALHNSDMPATSANTQSLPGIGLQAISRSDRDRNGASHWRNDRIHDKESSLRSRATCRERLITTPILRGSVSSQWGTSNQSATVCRCTTSTPSRSSAAGGDNNRRVPCHGSVEKETYDRRITRSKRGLPVPADGEFLQSTWLSIPCSANAVRKKRRIFVAAARCMSVEMQYLHEPSAVRLTASLFCFSGR